MDEGKIIEAFHRAGFTGAVWEFQPGFVLVEIDGTPWALGTLDGTWGGNDVPLAGVFFETEIDAEAPGLTADALVARLVAECRRAASPKVRACALCRHEIGTFDSPAFASEAGPICSLCEVLDRAHRSVSTPARRAEG